MPTNGTAISKSQHKKKYIAKSNIFTSNCDKDVIGNFPENCPYIINHEKYMEGIIKFLIYNTRTKKYHEFYLPHNFVDFEKTGYLMLETIKILPDNQHLLFSGIIESSGWNPTNWGRGNKLNITERKVILWDLVNEKKLYELTLPFYNSYSYAAFCNRIRFIRGSNSN